jgi:hypothetical protein
MKSIIESKEIFLGLVRDSVSNLFYYDRKNDEDLSVNEVDQLIRSGQITLSEILEVFTDEIQQNTTLE